MDDTRADATLTDGTTTVKLVFQFKALIHEELSRLKGMQARGCCLVGHPEYYKKFGFDNIPGLAHEGVPPEVFLALSFDEKIPQGTVTFHEGFKADGQQERAGDA